MNNIANNVTLPNINGNDDNMFNNGVQDNGVNDDNIFNNGVQDNGTNDNNMFNNNVLYIG